MQATTFAQSVNAYLETHKARWRNAEHAAQWGSTITACATQRSAGWRAAPGQPTTFTKSLDQSGRRSRKPHRGCIAGHFPGPALGILREMVALKGGSGLVFIGRDKGRANVRHELDRCASPHGRR